MKINNIGILIVSLCAGASFSSRSLAHEVVGFNPDVVFVGTGPAAVALLESAVGISGYTIEDYEDGNLIPGLTYQNHLAESDTLTALELSSNRPNTIWGGIQSGLCNVNNAQVGDAIFRIAGGVDSFGVGIADAESNVRLIVNGIDLGRLTDIPNFKVTGNTPLQLKQVYLRIDRQVGDEPITEVRFKQFGPGGGDIIFFDHLAVFPNPQNILPTAAAGSDQSIRAGETVALDGSHSFDDNTDSLNLSYSWSFSSIPVGSSTTLIDEDTATPSFVADVAGTYCVSLEVTDEGGLTDIDEVMVSSDNLAPTAVANSDLAIYIVGDTVSLDGTGSSDPDPLDLLTFSWSHVAPTGSASSISDPASPTPTLLVDVAGTYDISLTVSDFIGPGTPDSVSIVATTAEDFAVIKIIESSDVVLVLEPGQVTTGGNQNALGNFFQQAIAAINNDDPATAIDKLEKALTRTDGCIMNTPSVPDEKGPGRDWVVDCAVQSTLYGLLTDAIDALNLQ